MRMKFFGATLFVLILQSGCTGFRPLDHEALQAQFWKKPQYQTLTLEQKLMDPPSELIDYLIKDNAHQGYLNKPKAIVLPLDFRNDLLEALKEMPEKVKRRLQTELLGIFVVDNLGTSALTDSVYDEKKEPIGGFVVLNRSALNRTANAWASWKESSPFTEDFKYRIKVRIENEAQDNRKNALQYILLHEFGHILAIRGKVHPPWGKEFAKGDDPKNYEFSKISWRKNFRNRYESLWEDVFPLRKSIQYYRDPKSKLPAEKMIQSYDELEKTNFVTLYAATNPFDDFAETFVTYVHQVMMNRPFEIQILRGQKVLKSFHLCWKESRCEGKRKIIEKML